jgi:hypothetical protein
MGREPGGSERDKLWGSKVDGTGSGLCPTIGTDSNVEYLGYATAVSIQLQNTEYINIID